jgi:hypothetical protein
MIGVDPTKPELDMDADLIAEMKKAMVELRNDRHVIELARKFGELQRRSELDDTWKSRDGYRVEAIMGKLWGVLESAGVER